MNKAQRVILGFGLSAFLALGLFPPCVAVRGPSRFVAGHFFVFSLPMTTSNSAGYTFIYEIDYKRLGVLLGILAVVTLGGVVLFKK